MGMGGSLELIPYSDDAHWKRFAVLQKSPTNLFICSSVDIPRPKMYVGLVLDFLPCPRAEIRQRRDTCASGTQVTTSVTSPRMERTFSHSQHPGRQVVLTGPLAQGRPENPAR